MEQKRRALGRGLEQLFGNESFDLNDFEKTIVKTSTKEDVKEINLDELRSNPYQPRQNFDPEKLDELCSSIKEYGVIEPIIVKKSIKGYEIVAGERRTLASRKAGLMTIPAIVREFSDEDMMSIALLENIQREDLNAIEEANAYKKMLELTGLTQEVLSKKVGKSRSYLTNMLGLLKLPKRVQDLVSNGKISMGHARVLSKLSDENEIFALSQKIINENLSVRDIEDISSESSVEKRNSTKKTESLVNESYKMVQHIMREKIGTMVRVNNKKIVIPFDSEKDLERILEILNIKIDLE